MAFYSFFTLIFLTLTVTTATAAAATTTTTASDATTASFDLDNLVSAIISAGNFQDWATLLSTNPHFLPPNSTLFIPVITTATKNTTVSPPFINRHPFSTATYNEDFVFHHHDNHHHRKIPPLIQSYVLLLHHTVPHRLSFSDLIQLPATTRLPNLLPNFTLLITTENRSVSCNLSIQGSCVTHPNLYEDESISVHGISTPLDRKPIKLPTWTELYMKILEDPKRFLVGKAFDRMNVIPLINEFDGQMMVQLAKLKLYLEYYEWVQKTVERMEKIHKEWELLYIESQIAPQSHD